MMIKTSVEPAYNGMQKYEAYFPDEPSSDF